MTNLVQACHRHHRLLHEGGFRVELGEDGEVRFYRPDGRPVPNVPPPARVEEDAEARLRSENEARGIDIGPWTATPDWHGERFDIHYGLWTLYGQYAEDPYADDRGRDDPNTEKVLTKAAARRGATEPKSRYPSRARRDHDSRPRRCAAP